MLLQARPRCVARSPSNHLPCRIVNRWRVACNSIPAKISRDSTENSAECERRRRASSALEYYPTEHSPPGPQRLLRKTDRQHGASTWLGPTLTLIRLDALAPQTVV